MNKTLPSVFFLSLMNGAAWGGSEELWYRTALWLANKGAKVACAVYDWREKEHRTKALQKAGCEVFLLPNPKRKTGSGLKRIFTKLEKKAQLKKAIDALPVEQYGMTVISQGGYEVYTPTWKNFYRRLKNYVLLFHNYNEQQVFSARQKAVLKHWMQRASKNLFAANRIQVVLEKKLNIKVSNADVFVNPITFQPPAQATSFPSLLNGHYQWAMFAALDVSRKAQDKIIQVLSSEKWKQRNWQLHLYGEGKDRALLQQLIAQYNLQQKVFLSGHTNHVAAAMNEAHLILQITNIDAMPLTVIEAMAIARPLIVSRIGDMPLWVNERENGWVCGTNVEAIEACLEEAWQAREQWATMGAKSFEIFQQKFPAEIEETFLQQILP